MMWNPNCDFTRSLVWPGAIAKAAFSNSGTMRPRVKKSRSPPCSLDVSSDTFRASSAKSAPALIWASTASACVRTAASSLPSVLSRMWLARICSGVWYCWMFAL